MTNWFECQDAETQTDLSSRPERSVVEGPAVAPSFNRLLSQEVG
jgi:hypothetical protein